MQIFDMSKIMNVTAILLFASIISSCATKNSSVTVDDVNKVVCKSYLPTNSRIAIKDCRTKGEWEEVRRTAQKSLDDSTRPVTNNPNGR